MKAQFFKLAKEVSKLSDHPKFMIGSVIVRKNKVVSVGANYIKTHPKSPHPYHMIHSEIRSILNAKTDLTGCDIYVYRETKDGIVASARPCKYCMELIKASGIDNIYFTDSGRYCEEKV